ncbi:MAG: RND transporter [Bacteroidota bacterium]
MNNRNLIIAAVGVILLGVVAWQFLFKESAVSNDITINPTLGPFEVIVTTTGELRAKNSIEINGPSGTSTVGIYRLSISQIVPEGTTVNEGEFVASLDKQELQSKINESQLNLGKVQSQYTQAKLDTALTLATERNNIVNLKFTMEEKLAEIEQSRFEAPATQQKVRLEYEKAKRAHEQAVSNFQKQIAKSVAQVKEAESELNKEENTLNDLLTLERKFTIMAPAKGMVIYKREWDGKKRAVGSQISPWDPGVATLPDLSIMESVTYVNEIDIRKILEGQKVGIGLDAMPDKGLSGQVKKVANIGEQRPNSDSKVFEVVIEVNESDTTLRPSMTTSNEILISAIESAMYIPLECVHAEDSTSFVFMQNKGKLVKQQIETGLVNENFIQILKGLANEDDIYLSMPADTSGLDFVYLQEDGEKLASRSSN